MSKELEALERIRKARYFVDYELDANVGEDYKEELDIIENALKRLEKYDDEELEYDHANRGLTIELLCRENHKLVKEHKALEIIKKKRVNVMLICICKTLREYNNWADLFPLTQEEYDLLKEVLL